MDTEILKKLNKLEEKIETTCKSVERMRKYFFWTLIITVVTIVLPLVGLVIILPWFLKIITSAYSLSF